MSPLGLFAIWLLGTVTGIATAAAVGTLSVAMGLGCAAVSAATVALCAWSQR